MRSLQNVDTVSSVTPKPGLTSNQSSNSNFGSKILAFAIIGLEMCKKFIIYIAKEIYKQNDLCNRFVFVRSYQNIPFSFHLLCTYINSFLSEYYMITLLVTIKLQGFRNIGSTVGALGHAPIDI